MLTPRSEWQRVRGEPVGRALLAALLLAALPAFASFAMLQASELALPRSAVPLTYISWLLAIAILAAAFAALARLFAKRAARWQACVQLAVYGSVPLALASALLVSPVLVTVTVISLVHVFYLYYVGAQALLGVSEDDAAQFVAIAAVIAFGASTLAGGVVGSLGLL